MAAPAGKEGEVAGGSMSGIEAPPARRPTPPTPANLGRLAETPSFREHVEELERMSATGRELSEAAGVGKRLAAAATSMLQRGDAAGAAAALEEAARLKTPREIMGEELWNDPVIRLRLCEGNQVAWFIEARLEALSLQSFFERGVLTPEVPESCRICISDNDDERYLFGVLNALRELERYAVNRGQALDLPSLRQCLPVAQCLEQALMQFDFRNSDLRRRFDSVKYTVRKFENLAYEVDLALQRAAVTAAAAAAAAGGDAAAAPDVAATLASPGDAPAAVAPTATAEAEEATSAAGASPSTAAESSPPVAAIDLCVLEELKTRYDAFDASRNLVIKRSRDVTKAAKNAVYALQRSDFRKADAELKLCAQEASAIFAELASQTPTLRGGSLSCALEEFAEALAFRSFRRDRRLISRSEMQTQSGLSFPLALHEYLGGLMDLTGEVGRLAIRSTQRGRKAVPEVELCLACVDAVHTGLKELPYLPCGLGKKMGALRGTMSKIEGALYELSLLSQGLRVQAPAPSAGEGDEDADPARDDAATSRM